MRATDKYQLLDPAASSDVNFLVEGCKVEELQPVASPHFFSLLLVNDCLVSEA